MTMNVAAGVALVLLLLFAWRGHVKGLALEIASTISMILSILGIALIVRMVEKYLKDKSNDMVEAIIFFVVLAFLSQILNLIIKSLKIITKFPVIHGVDSFFGMVLGIVEGVFFLWAIMIAISRYDIAGYSEQIRAMIAENEVLAFLSKYNFLTKLF